MEGAGSGQNGTFWAKNYQRRHSASNLFPQPTTKPQTAIDRFLWGQGGVRNKEPPASFTCSSDCFGGGAYVGAASGTDGSMINWPPPPKLAAAAEASLLDGFFMDIGCATTEEKNMTKRGSFTRVGSFSSFSSSSSSSSSSVGLIKGQWTEEEDRKLIKLVKQHGERKWALIAEKLAGRAGKQCRERWHNHLRPDIKKDGWSEEEEKLLIEAHEKVGNKWAEIAKRIPGRTENAIKNHWNATKRRQNARKKSDKSGAGGVSSPQSGNAKPSSSVLQDYIRSKNLHNTAAATPCNNRTTNNDRLENIFHPPEGSKSATPLPEESPEMIDMIPRQMSEEDHMLFMKEFVSDSHSTGGGTTTHVSVDSAAAGEENSIVPLSSQYQMMSSLDPAGSFNKTAEDIAAPYLHSDLYLSHLLHGATSSSMLCHGYSNYDNSNYHGKLESVVLGMKGQAGPSSTYMMNNGKREMDLMELVSSSQFF